jgi:hypothetical protein
LQKFASATAGHNPYWDHLAAYARRFATPAASFDLLQSMRDYPAAAPNPSVVPPLGPTRRDSLLAMPFARPEGAGTAPMTPV